MPMGLKGQLLSVRVMGHLQGVKASKAASAPRAVLLIYQGPLLSVGKGSTPFLIKSMSLSV